jgi:hypothetical protein
MILRVKRGKGSNYESGPLDPSKKPGTFVWGSDLVEQGDCIRNVPGRACDAKHTIS